MSTYKTYGEKLKHPKWQMRRLKIMERDGARCTMCGCAERTLNVHHKKYSGENPWDAPDEDLITVCHFCHEIIEGAKKYNNSVYHIIVVDDPDCRLLIVFVITEDKLNCVKFSGFGDNFNLLPEYTNLRRESVDYINAVMKRKESMEDTAFKKWLSKNKYLPHRQPKTKEHEKV